MCFHIASLSEVQTSPTIYIANELRLCIGTWQRETLGVAVLS